MPDLAYIGQVTTIYPIPSADFIESLEVVCGPGGRWRGTAKKGDLALGDRCEVYLQDALLPQSERFAFLESRHWRIRMVRLKGVPSECLLMPLTEATAGLEPGADITELAGVVKYEKPMSANLGGDIRGSFPAFIPKTDEPNFQRAPDLVAALQGRPFYATLKVDGSSGTVFWDGDGAVRACRRRVSSSARPMDPRKASGRILGAARRRRLVTASSILRAGTPSRRAATQTEPARGAWRISSATDGNGPARRSRRFRDFARRRRTPSTPRTSSTASTSS